MNSALLRVMARDTRLTPTAARVALLFASVPDGDWVLISIPRIMTLLGVQDCATDRALIALVRYGYLERHAVYGSRHYRFAYRLRPVSHKEPPQ